MTTAAAWQRTIDRLDPETFGEVVADEVLDGAAELLGDEEPDGGYLIQRDDLRTLLGVGALTAFRRMIDACRLEQMTGDAEEDDPSYHALETTMGAVANVQRLLDAGKAEEARELLGHMTDSWTRAHR